MSAYKLKLTFIDDDDHFNRERWAHLDVSIPNVWWVSCYSDEEMMDRLENCQNLPGIDVVEVISWCG